MKIAAPRVFAMVLAFGIATTGHGSMAEPTGETALYLAMKHFDESCQNEFRAMASETDTPWEEGALRGVCRCLAAQYLLVLNPDQTEQDALELAQAMTSDRSVFRGFLLYEKVLPRCLPD